MKQVNSIQLIVMTTRMTQEFSHVLLSLNDDYDGGEFSFFNDEMLVRTNTGGVICFPSNFIPHGVREVVGGTRYAIVTWFR